MLFDKKIILIGMPGCGKSTLANGLALRLGWPGYDSDLEIEKQQGVSVSEIFSRFGEGYFRELETGCIQCLLQREGPAVISLGGGAVRNFVVSQDVGGETSPRIPVSLWQNCLIVYVHRNIEDIRCSVNLSDRPLLKDNPERLAELFAERHPLYEGLCHICIHNDSTIDEGVKKMWEAIRHYVEGADSK